MDNIEYYKLTDEEQIKFKKCLDELYNEKQQLISESKYDINKKIEDEEKYIYFYKFLIIFITKNTKKKLLSNKPSSKDYNDFFKEFKNEISTEITVEMLKQFFNGRIELRLDYVNNICDLFNLEKKMISKEKIVYDEIKKIFYDNGEFFIPAYKYFKEIYEKIYTKMLYSSKSIFVTGGSDFEKKTILNAFNNFAKNERIFIDSEDKDSNNIKIQIDNIKSYWSYDYHVKNMILDYSNFYFDNNSDWQKFRKKIYEAELRKIEENIIKLCDKKYKMFDKKWTIDNLINDFDEIIEEIYEKYNFKISNIQIQVEQQSEIKQLKSKQDKQFKIEIKERNSDYYKIAVWFKGSYDENVNISRIKSNRFISKNNLICDFLDFLAERMNLNVKINQFERYTEIKLNYNGISSFLSKDFLPFLQKNCSHINEKIPVKWIKNGIKENTSFTFEVLDLTKNQPSKFDKITSKIN